MRIALVISSLGTGGAERVMALLANYWVERGDEVTLITLETTSIDAYPLDERVKRVALGLIQDSPGLARALCNNWTRLRAIRRAIRESGAAAVLAFTDLTNVLVILATLGMPVRRVVAERTDPTRHDIGRMWGLLRRLTYPLADAVVVQTERLLPWARRVTLSRAKAYAIPNPLRPLHKPANGRVHEPLVVALGRLWPEKGHDVLIRAFAELAAEFPEWHLTIVGEGPERDALAALAKSLRVHERVSMPGWLAVPEAVLANAGVFVMSSRYEGFPNALLEAMGMGLPVISTACGGTEEMIEAGSSGIVVAVDDPAALARAMRDLMADAALRQRLASCAYAASQRYTHRSVMPMWDTVLSN